MKLNFFSDAFTNHVESFKNWAFSLNKVQIISSIHVQTNRIFSLYHDNHSESQWSI